MSRTIRLDHLIHVFEVGSGEWSWQEERTRLYQDQYGRMRLLEMEIRTDGIREPVLLGSDGRVWDGHHRIAAAMTIGLDAIPVEFATEASKQEIERSASEKAWDEGRRAGEENAGDGFAALLTGGTARERTNPYRRKGDDDD